MTPGNFPTIVRQLGLALFLGLAMVTTMAALSQSKPARAHTTEADGMTVIHPWTEPAAEGGQTRAHPTLTNNTGMKLVLTGVRTPVAERVEIVAGGKDDGRPVECLGIAGGETLGTEQFHLRLIGLKRALQDGGHFPATLSFADGREIEIVLVVGESTMMPDMDTQTSRAE